ncbi:hypothetical protein BJP62_05935 [Jeongeupia sp. USM3]|nr:hypothetical protein BJP62_05935 [Jeongeupia sp. USM3]
MNLAVVAAAISAGFAISAAPVQAGGSIAVVGAVNSSTCVVDGAAAGQAVVLPSVGVSALPNLADTAGDTPFSISMTDCAVDAGKTHLVHAFFEAGPRTNSEGRLTPDRDTGGADGVEIEVLNEDRTPVRLGWDDASQNSQKVVVNADGSIQMQYVARYYRSGELRPGELDASVQYSIVYE